MKVTKRILAIVMTALMLLGTCGVAASAAGSLQAAINAAGEGDTVTMTGDTTESVVINKDLTLDLGGYELKGVPGSPAITVNGANVTITNGHVVSQFANVKSLTMMEMVVNESPAAINVKGGSVEVIGVRAVGSMTRIPTTSRHFFPTGSAIALTDGATATVQQSSLVGRYGINNNVTDATAGGDVTIEDAILMGFMRGVKDTSNVTIPDGTEEVNAADRIEGFLSKPYKLEDRERNLLKRFFAERVMIYTKAVEDYATYQLSACSGSAKVTAHEDTRNVWQNNTSTDCSYMFVPEYVKLADGTLIPMTKTDEVDENDNTIYTAILTEDQTDFFEVKYRLVFVMQPDIESLTNNFNMYLEDLYNKVIKTVGEVYDYALEKYTTYTNMVGEIMQKLNYAGSTSLSDNRQISDLAEFKRLRKAIYDIGGATCYNAVEKDLPFDEIIMRNVYGPDATYQEGDVVGTIDRVAKLKEELESFMPFSDQSKWADLGYWAFEKYPEVLDIIDEALDRIETLQDVLDGDMEKMIIERANLQDKREKLDKVQKITSDGKAALDKLLSSHTIQYFIDKANSHKSELKPYINKFINIYNNHEKYFDPDKFVDGNLAKAYAVYGGVDMDGEPLNDHLFGDWVSDGDETHTRTCERCGETETVEHDLDTTITEPTCTTPGETKYTCEDCGYEKVIEGDPVNGHHFGDWEFVTVEQHEHFCEVCGESETEDHKFSSATVDATCTENGTITYTCDGCGYSYEETIESPGHTEDDPVIENEVEATCEEGGSYDTVVYCSVCGEELSRETTTTDPAGHDFEGAEWVLDPDDPDQHIRFCNICGIEYETAAHQPGETMIENEVDATCTENGGYDEVVYCTDCEAELSRNHVTESASGHDLTAWQSDNDETHSRYCNNDCGFYQTAAHDLDAVVTEPTCLVDGSITYTCEDCGYTKTVAGDPAPGHHEFGDWEFANLQQHERFCEVCGETETDDHHFSAEIVEPTCTEEGKITYTCDDCGYSYSVDGDPSNGHTSADPVKENIVEPTCGTAGSHDEVVYCSVCGEELSRETVIDDATGEHDFDGAEWVLDPDNPDQHIRFCNNCGLGSETAAHNAGETKIENKVDPTCTEDGSHDEVVYCTDCEAELSRNHVVDPKNGHKPGETQIENKTNPTCTEDGGYDEVVYCTVCGEELSRNHVDDPKKGHKPGETQIENKTNPTCTEDGGYDEVVYCTVCGEELSRNHVDDPKKGHKPGETQIENNVTVTCTTDGGYDEVVYCTVCGEVLSRNHVTDPAPGHDWTAWTDNGPDDHIHTCQRCGTNETQAHSFTEWTVVKEATKDEEGEETRTCPICGRTESRPIPKLSNELTLTDSITHQTPANRISVKVPYARRGTIGVTLIASEEDVTWTSSKPKLLTVDENGNVRFVRLCVFCRTATITATTPDGRTASCVVTLKLKWWQYIVYLLFGWLWY